MTDPTRSLKRRIAVTWLVGLGAAVSLGVWAWAPAETQLSSEFSPRPASTSSLEVAETDRLDPGRFDVTLWRVLPVAEPPADPVVERRPAPPRLTLVAIIREPAASGPVLRAALHDPDEDRLLTVAAGDLASVYTVTRVTDEGVELRDGPQFTWLALRPDESEGGSQ